jgi:hypothetical protein
MATDKKYALDDNFAVFPPEKQKNLHKIDAFIEHFMSIQKTLDPFVANIQNGKEIEKQALIDIIKAQNLKQLGAEAKKLQAQINRAQATDPNKESTSLSNAERAGLIGMAMGVGCIVAGIAGFVAGVITAPVTFGAGTAVGVITGVAACKEGLALLVAGRNKYAGIAPEDPMKLSKAEWRVNDIENDLNSALECIESISNSVNKAIGSVVSFFSPTPEAAITTPSAQVYSKAVLAH